MNTIPMIPMPTSQFQTHLATGRRRLVLSVPKSIHQGQHRVLRSNPSCHHCDIDGELSTFSSFYVPLLVIPWVLTCVLAVRPLNAPSYINQGGGISPYEIISIASWLAVVQVLNSIEGVVTIPIMSTLLAQAAIVYSQRRRAKQSLSITQLCALADRGWSDITTLWGAFVSNEAGTSSRFFWSAAILIIISNLSCNRS